MRFHELIGNTRQVRLDRIPAAEGVAPDVRILAKLEGDNPGGSVKDRAAWGMLSGWLERHGGAEGAGGAGGAGGGRGGNGGDRDARDVRFVEATSGNTGIALAMVAGRMGLHMRLIVPFGATQERVAAMRAYGAEVIRTAEGETIEDARRMAEAMASSGEYQILNQFGNPDNPAMHYRTTGPEIWRDTDGGITHFVSAMGTTGTIMGTGRFLKEKNSAVQVVGAQPSDGSRIPGIRKWSPDMTPAIYDPARVDRLVEVSESQARAMTRRLATEEGILAGMSSGGVLVAALEVARELDAGTVVFIVCDRGDRYLTSDLFEMT